MSDVDKFLDFGLFNDPLLGVRGLHESLGLLAVDYVHFGQCAEDVHADVVTALALVDNLEEPTLVHPHVLLVDYDLALVLAGCVDQVQTASFAAREDEDGILEPRDLKDSVGLESEELCLISFVEVDQFQNAIEMQYRSSMILDPQKTILIGNYLKPLIGFLPPHLQLGLIVVNGDDKICLDVHDFILGLSEFLEHPELVHIVRFHDISCNSQAVPFLHFVGFGF